MDAASLDHRGIMNALGALLPVSMLVVSLAYNLFSLFTTGDSFFSNEIFLYIGFAMLALLAFFSAWGTDRKEGAKFSNAVLGLLGALIWIFFLLVLILRP